MTTQAIINMIMFYSQMMNVDANVALAVAKVESNFKVDAVSSVGAVGIFQVVPRYSKYSRKELFNPEINVKEGLRILKEAKRRCVHQVGNTWVLCFSHGHTGATKLRYPASNFYVQRVNRTLEAM